MQDVFCVYHYSTICTTKMNQKSYSVLFCVLLASTLVHAKGVFLLNALEVGLKGAQVNAIHTDFAKKFDRVDHGLLLDRLDEVSLDVLLVKFLKSLLGGSTLFDEDLRAKSLAAPTIVANERLEAVGRPGRSIHRPTRSTPAELLGLTLSVTADVVIVVNSTSGSAIAIDVVAKVFVLLNGETRSGIVIDLVNNNGAYIKEGLWEASEGTVKEFIVSLSKGIKGLVTLKGAVSFKLGQVPKNILAEVTKIAVNLVAIIDVQLEADNTFTLNLMVTIAVEITSSLNGPLLGLLKALKGLDIALSVDIIGLVHLLKGFGEFVAPLTGNIEAAIQLGVKLDLTVILGAENGLVTLINIMLQFGLHLDLSVLAGLLGSVDSLFLLIAKLGGNAKIGISGVFGVAAQIVLLIEKKVTIDAYVALVDYVAYSHLYVEVDLSVELKATLGVLLDTLEKVNATETLSDLGDVVEDLIEGTLEVDGINVGAIIFKLLADVVGAVDGLLVLIVEILVLLVGVVQLAVSLVYLSLVLITKLINPYGIVELIALGIELKLSLDGILVGVLKAALLSVKNLLALLAGKFYKVLITLPLIGPIVKALDAAIKKATDGDVSLEDLLNASSLIQGWIKALIQILTGIPVPVSRAVVVQLELMLNGCLSAGVYVGLGSLSGTVFVG